jgi:hypothetical protein
MAKRIEAVEPGTAGSWRVPGGAEHATQMPRPVVCQHCEFRDAVAGRRRIRDRRRARHEVPMARTRVLLYAAGARSTERACQQGKNVNALRLFAAILSLFLVLPLRAAELPEPGFHVWSGDQRGVPSTALSNLLSLDVFPGVPGIELLGSAESLRFSAPDANNKIRATVIRSFIVKDSSGVNTLFSATPLPRVLSGSFPDPSVAANQCGGANATRYWVDDRALGCASLNFPQCLAGGVCFPASDFTDRFPDDTLSMGMANAQGERFLVIGKQVYGRYFNNLDGEVDIDTYSVTAYRLDGQRAWTSTFPLLSNGYELVPELSGVAAFSGGDDQLRVASVRELAASRSYLYRTYSIDTGALLQTVKVSAPLP